MSTKNWSRKSVLMLGLAALIGLFALSAATSLGQEGETDEILDFYRNRAEASAKSRDPFQAGISFSLTAHSYYQLIPKEDQPIPDSSVVTYYFSFGELDSLKVLEEGDVDFRAEDLRVFSPFVADYQFNFFPNDTGGPLAIGLDNRTDVGQVPVGVAVVDRDLYYIDKLYLYYPDSRKDLRHSLVLTTQLVDGYVFPDTIVRSGAEAGFFKTIYYRQTTYVDNVKIHR